MGVQSMVMDNIMEVNIAFLGCQGSMLDYFTTTLKFPSSFLKYLGRKESHTAPF